MPTPHLRSFSLRVLRLLRHSFGLVRISQGILQVGIIAVMLPFLQIRRDGVVVLLQLRLRETHAVVNARGLRSNPQGSLLFVYCACMILLVRERHAKSGVSLGIVRVEFR